MSDTIVNALYQRVNQHLLVLYPEQDCNALTQSLLEDMRLTECDIETVAHQNLWDQQSILTITYANSIVETDKHPLHTLSSFLHTRLSDIVSGVHILPFYPSSGDDGFAVSDYSAVDPSLGDWQDVKDISEDFSIMGDLVINHASGSHRWFNEFKAGEAPGKDYFFTAKPNDDLTTVVRPRTSELLQAIDTPDGVRHVWCTFGHDQIDLDFRNSNVLREFVKIIRHYLDNGISIFRLDAVAFLWKKIGTNCLNLNETHEVVRLLRTLIEHANPEAVIITETNIPNQENLSYFGNANEAHCIYNFSLPPLLVHALVSGNGRHLKNWLMSMPPAQNGTAYFNFIASHDGIGLRPVEGLIDDQELHAFIRTMESFGGHISWRSLNGGLVKKPYEVNIALYDALSGTTEGKDEFQLDRFILAHAIMLALEGIPGIYIHSLLGTENDYHRVERLGYARAINRKQWPLIDIESLLDNPDSHHFHVFNRLSGLIKIRRKQSAFHPNATQFTLHLGDAIFAFWRQSMDRKQSIFCLNNLSNQTQEILPSAINLIVTDTWYDLISGDTVTDMQTPLTLAPYQAIWLTNQLMS